MAVEGEVRGVFSRYAGRKSALILAFSPGRREAFWICAGGWRRLSGLQSNYIRRRAIDDRRQSDAPYQRWLQSNADGGSMHSRKYTGSKAAEDCRTPKRFARIETIAEISTMDWQY